MILHNPRRTNNRKRQQIHNPDFNYLEFEVIELEAGRNAFVLTPKRWIESVGAIGMVSNTMTPDQVAEAAAAFARISWEAFYAPDDDEPEADATPDA